MTDADAVRRVALPLPRAVERQTGGRWKHYIGQIVFNKTRRFTDPALDARLLRRTATGPMVIDEEIVTRTGRAGAIERVRVTGIYTVAADRIVAARFAEAPLSG